MPHRHRGGLPAPRLHYRRQINVQRQSILSRPNTRCPLTWDIWGDSAGNGFFLARIDLRSGERQTDRYAKAARIASVINARSALGLAATHRNQRSPAIIVVDTEPAGRSPCIRADAALSRIRHTTIPVSGGANSSCRRSRHASTPLALQARVDRSHRYL
jgi:hypothetical protein